MPLKELCPLIKGHLLGSFGTLSFHETKNVIAGERDDLLVNDEKASLKAEIIREKSIDRSGFFRRVSTNTPGE